MGVIHYSCSYCHSSVKEGKRGSWIDSTGSDRCLGDSSGANKNGVHRVFDPIAGYPGVCVEFVLDPYNPEPTCFRCYQHVELHEENS